jgi:uncharacterized membrane protein YbaN (DUF454 family)
MSLLLMQSTAVADAGPRLHVVHTLRGRVRIHLPDGLDLEGELAARVTWIPGVTSASANALTGNILILFDPQQTTERALLSELEALCLDHAIASHPDRGCEEVILPGQSQGQLLPRNASQSDSPPAGGAQYVTGLRRTVYKSAGWLSIVMAVIGAITPGIPTVPFVVLAAYFFVRSSPEAHAWLLRSRWFGGMLRDWEEHRAVTLQVKYGAVALILAAMVITLMVGLPLAVLLTIYAFEIIGLAIVLRLPVVERSSALPEFVTT